MLRNSRDGEFSVNTTSAGELAPSATTCWARVFSSALRTCTAIPVACSNASTSVWVVWGCWPL